MLTKIIPFLASLLLPLYVFAAPSNISTDKSTVAHGDTLIISGSGFGSKSTAAPFLWDNCSGTDILALWSNYMIGTTGYGGSGGDTTKDLAYRTPAQAGRSVALPHTHITKYMCGSHYVNFVGDGSDIMPWVYNTATLSDPTYIYVTWYRRLDPNWVWQSDYNFKDFVWSNTTDSTPWVGNRFISHYDASLYPPYYNGLAATNQAFSGVVNERWKVLEQGWVKTEIEAKFTTSGGYFKLWEDGTLKLHETGNTWLTSGPKCIAIESFYRIVNSNNWRYMADIYIDYSAQRVLIGNANTLAGCTTLRAVQIPSAWSDTSITVKINQDAFADGAKGYVYVFDATGTPNSSGYEITFGSSPAPAPPTISNATISNGRVQ